jgi:hypothetical protein
VLIPDHGCDRFAVFLSNPIFDDQPLDFWFCKCRFTMILSILWQPRFPIVVEICGRFPLYSEFNLIATIGHDFKHATLYVMSPGDQLWISNPI